MPELPHENNCLRNSVHRAFVAADASPAYPQHIEILEEMAVGRKLQRGAAAGWTVLQ
jgi:hypothetical protein